jgi:TRAP-type uncharacterized transport system fused permease subunit
MKNFVLFMLVSLLSMAGLSQAAIDTTTVLSGITDAGTAIAAVIGGLMALSVSIFGIAKVYSFISRKAGA